MTAAGSFGDARLPHRGAWRRLFAGHGWTIEDVIESLGSRASEATAGGGRANDHRPLVCAVLGDGARRIAVARRMKEEPGVGEVLVSPPVPGRLAAGLVSLPMGDVNALAGWMRALGVALAIVVNERLLLAGIVDRLRAEGLLVFGATRAMAARHAERATAKRELGALGVPTPAWREIEDRAELERAYRELGPIWLKRSPRLGERSVIAVRDHGDLFMAWRRLGAEKPAQVIAEQHGDGDDVAVTCLVAGGHVAVLPPVQAFRRRSPEAGSPLTEGMGARTVATGRAFWLATEVGERVIAPMLSRPGAAEGGFCGTLTVRVRLGDEEWTVLGVDCHWGDPETQTALAATDVCMTDILEAVASPRREDVRITVCSQACMAVSVVMARGEYPDAGDYPPLRYRPDAVRGRETTFAPYDGTPEGQEIHAYSGRFCSLTAAAPTLSEACERAARDAQRIVELHPGLDYNRAVCQPATASTEGGPRWNP